ncbi:ComEC/Rec2 family competence protein [Zavarzinia sp. CC-PAN008]|uniref:ComEC/Rec2 family competence protein n=1 Tax=Zavarzinia sp. CC-PAN008 TaxID=3243332 RepID=UPI003F74A3E9
MEGIVRWLRALRGQARTDLALWVPVAMGVGIGLYFAQGTEPHRLVGAALLAAALAATALRRRWPWLQRPMVLVVALALGFAAIQVRAGLVGGPVIAQRLGAVEVTGLVREAERTGPSSLRAVLADLHIAGLAPEATPRRLRLTLRTPGLAVPLPGTRIRVRALVQPVPGPVAPGAYDFGRSLWFAGIGGLGIALGPPDVLGAEGGLQATLAALRVASAERIVAALPGNAGTIAAALIVGERGAMSDEAEQAWRDSGLTHILSISGLHMTIVGGLVFVGLRRLLVLVPALALRFPVKKWAAAGALLTTAGYVVFSGGGPPAERSFVMMAVMLLAVLFDRTAVTLRAVALAALILLLLRPESLLDIGFQMSFAAVTALIAAYEALRDRGPRRAELGLAGRIGLGLGGIAFSGLIAGVATAPFGVFHFNQTAVYGMAANLVAVPLTSLWIMPWGVVAALTLPVGLEATPLALMGAGIDLADAVANTVARWPGAVLPVPSFGLGALLVLVAAGLWLCLWRGPVRLLALTGLALGLILAASDTPPDALIGDEGRSLALVQGEQLGVLGSTRGFAVRAWARRAGATPVAMATLAPCDSLGCVVQVQGQRLALITRAEAGEEDCSPDAIVLSLARLGRSCPARLVIDATDVRRAGTHAVTLGPAGPVVETVAAWRGVRPWVGRRSAPPVRERREMPATSPQSSRNAAPGSPQSQGEIEDIDTSVEPTSD